MAQLVKNPPAMKETWVWFLDWEDSPVERKGYSFQYSGLQNSMDCIVHGVAKRWTQLSNFRFHFQLFHSAQAFSWPSEALTHWWEQSALQTLLWDITLPTKVHLVKAMVFPVVMYGCESWTIKKAEHWRIDAFELWCWRRLLRAPWTERRSNQSILKEISPKYSLERPKRKVKLQYFDYLMRRANSLRLGEIEGRRRG